MTRSERAALLHVLTRIRPQISIEIGTFRAGSLRPISEYSESVYTFDIDPNQHRISPMFRNCTFVTGDTAVTLPPIIEAINNSADELNFILIDGSHEEEGVRLDVMNCLAYIPKTRPCVIMMHDSCNPVVRAGLEKADWNSSPHVRGVDLDFVNGSLYDRSDIHGQIWGGLGLAVLTPEHRSGPVTIDRKFEYSRSFLLENSVYKSAS
jgi:hypothetical protein